MQSHTVVISVALALTHVASACRPYSANPPDPGAISTGSDPSQCQDCPLGTAAIQFVTPQICSLLPGYYYKDYPSTTSPTLCPQGSICDGAGQATSCPIGYYCRPGSAPNTGDLGIYPVSCASVYGQGTPCIPNCKTTQYIDSTGCVDCTPGYECNGTTRSECTAGYYSDKPGADACTFMCANGNPAPWLSYSTSTALGSTATDTNSCVPCAAPTVNYGNNTCTNCEPGTKYTTDGNCVPCGYGNIGNSGFCSPCSLGSYTETLEASECKQCAENHYSTVPGGPLSCIPCPPNTCSPSGSTECYPITSSTSSTTTSETSTTSTTTESTTTLSSSTTATTETTSTTSITTSSSTSTSSATTSSTETTSTSTSSETTTSLSTTSETISSTTSASTSETTSSSSTTGTTTTTSLTTTSSSTTSVSTTISTTSSTSSYTPQTVDTASTASASTASFTVSSTNIPSTQTTGSVAQSTATSTYFPSETFIPTNLPKSTESTNSSTSFASQSASTIPESPTSTKSFASSESYNQLTNTSATFFSPYSSTIQTYPPSASVIPPGPSCDPRLPVDSITNPCPVNKPTGIIASLASLPSPTSTPFAFQGDAVKTVAKMNLKIPAALGTVNASSITSSLFTITEPVVPGAPVSFKGADIPKPTAPGFNAIVLLLSSTQYAFDVVPTSQNILTYNAASSSSVIVALTDDGGVSITYVLPNYILSEWYVLNLRVDGRTFDVVASTGTDALVSVTFQIRFIGGKGRDGGGGFTIVTAVAPVVPLNTVGSTSVGSLSSAFRSTSTVIGVTAPSSSVLSSVSTTTVDDLKFSSSSASTYTSTSSFSSSTAGPSLSSKIPVDSTSLIGVSLVSVYTTPVIPSIPSTTNKVSPVNLASFTAVGQTLSPATLISSPSSPLPTTKAFSADGQTTTKGIDIQIGPASKASVTFLMTLAILLV
ncbi:hypothetical protein HDU79_004074 [Rhizoclosmatium sp. JEL0117]|nr:hypothetical protein HDU79_004074 [Rhizoclosmatium sp. JEL0117]